MLKHHYFADKNASDKLPSDWEIGNSHGLQRTGSVLPHYKKYPVLYNGEKDIFLILTDSADGSKIHINMSPAREPEETSKVLITLPADVKEALLKKIAEWRKTSPEQASKELKDAIRDLFESAQPLTPFESARAFEIKKEQWQVFPDIMIMEPAGLVIVPKVTHTTADGKEHEYTYPVTTDQHGNVDDIVVVKGNDEQSPDYFPHPVRVTLAALAKEVAERMMMPILPDCELQDTIHTLLQPSEEEAKNPLSCIPQHVVPIIVLSPPLFADSYIGITDKVTQRNWSVTVETLPVSISEPEAESQSFIHTMCVMATDNETGERYYLKERGMETKTDLNGAAFFHIDNIALVKMGKTENEDLSSEVFNNTIPSEVRQAMVESYRNTFASLRIDSDLKAKLCAPNKKEMEARAENPELFAEEETAVTAPQARISFSQKARQRAADALEKRFPNTR